MTTLPKGPTIDYTTTTLNGAISSSATSVTVNDASFINTPCYAVIDRVDANGTSTPNLREVVYVSSKASNVLTIARSQNDSTARSHNTAAKFEVMITVGFWEDVYDNFYTKHDATGKHNITEVVMVSGATIQTVASKILSSPTINNGWSRVGTYTNSIVSASSLAGGSMTSILVAQATITYPKIATTYINSPTITQFVIAGEPTSKLGGLGFMTASSSLRVGNGSATSGRALCIGQWFDYTPTYVGLTIGNGTLENSCYYLEGNNCFVHWYFVYGSTSTISADVQIKLPWTARANASGSYFRVIDHAGSIYDSNTAVSYILGAYISSATMFNPSPILTTGTYGSVDLWDATHPITIAVNDRIGVTFRYECTF